MSYRIRRVEQGDAFTLAAIQTTSWKTAFRGIVADNDPDQKMIRFAESATS